MEAEGLQLCVAFLLGASVGYAIRAAISSVRRAKVRRQGAKELAHAGQYSAALDPSNGGPGASKLPTLSGFTCIG
jgi:hypothetical protein